MPPVASFLSIPIYYIIYIYNYIVYIGGRGDPCMGVATRLIASGLPPLLAPHQVPLKKAKAVKCSPLFLSVPRCSRVVPGAKTPLISLHRPIHALLLPMFPTLGQRQDKRLLCPYRLITHLYPASASLCQRWPLSVATRYVGVAT